MSRVTYFSCCIIYPMMLLCHIYILFVVRLFPLGDLRDLEFFWRADLDETLQRLWDSIKSLPFNVILKLVKIAAIITAVVLLAHNISLVGVLGLAVSIAGLLFAAISNVLVWIIYLPMLLIDRPFGASSIVFAILMSWLIGIGPLGALVLSPVILLGIHILESSSLAQKHVSDLISAIEEIAEQINLRTGVDQVAVVVAGFIRRIVPKRTSPLLAASA